MAVIVPRWEWRTFGPGVDVAEPRLAGLEPTGVQESDELYLLTGTRPTAKVRDNLMDIKALIEVDRNGLEQWRPVMKVAFPLPAADVARTFEALGLPAPATTRDTYTLDEFLAEFGGPSGPVRAVRVHKRRVRYRDRRLHLRGVRGRRSTTSRPGRSRSSWRTRTPWPPRCGPSASATTSTRATPGASRGCWAAGGAGTR